MRIRITTYLPVAAAVIVGSALLTACNDSHGSPGSDAAQQTASTPSSSPSESAAASSPTASASATGGSAAAGTPVTVGKSFTDDVTGAKATVIKYVVGYHPSAAAESKYSALSDEQVVLVNVKATASSKYYDTFGADSFYLTGLPNGIDGASTTILDEDIKAAGYPPLPDAETGKTTTGWVVFTPDKDVTHIVLRYKRLAANASDGTKISAKNFDIPLN